MTIFNYGFKFQNATHADTIKQYEVWPDNLSSSAVGIGQFCYRIIIIIEDKSKQ